MYSTMKTFIYDIFNHDVPGFIHRVKVISSQAVINIKSVIFTMWKLQAAIILKAATKIWEKPVKKQGKCNEQKI